MRRNYAGQITKDYLKKLGVEYVAPQGTCVIRNGRSVNISISKKAKKPYGKVTFYDSELRQNTPKELRNAKTGVVVIDIHVLNYVWNKADKPAGMIIDHIDNNPLNNDISNLQCITPKENVNKEKTNWNVYELKCKLDRPLSYYEDKLKYFEEQYEAAKEAHDAKLTHKFRTQVCQTRARIRYYNAHKEDFHSRKEELALLKRELDAAHKYWKEAREYYGEKDEYVLKLWGEWKLAIAKYYNLLKKK